MLSHTHKHKPSHIRLLVDGCLVTSGLADVKSERSSATCSLHMYRIHVHVLGHMHMSTLISDVARSV